MRRAQAFLAGIKKQHLLTSTVPENGDQNPYAMADGAGERGSCRRTICWSIISIIRAICRAPAAPSSITAPRPGRRRPSPAFPRSAGLPRRRRADHGDGGAEIRLGDRRQRAEHRWHHQDAWPGLPDHSDISGKVAGTITGPEIADPWGNMAWIDNGDTATLFVSNVGFGIGAPGQAVQNNATVLRIGLSIAAGKPPGGDEQDRDRQRVFAPGRCQRIPDRADRAGLGQGRHALCFGCDRQPDGGDCRCGDPQR